VADNGAIAENNTSVVISDFSFMVSYGFLRWEFNEIGVQKKP
jgi:hypothetical protein